MTEHPPKKANTSVEILNFKQIKANVCAIAYKYGENFTNIKNILYKYLLPKVVFILIN